MPPAPQASYTLTLELSEADSNFDDKIDILEINGLQQATEFVLRADAAPDEGLLPLLRLLSLQGAIGARAAAPAAPRCCGCAPLPAPRTPQSLPPLQAWNWVRGILSSGSRGGAPPTGNRPALRALPPLVTGAGADAFLLESIFRSEAWEHMQLPVSEDNERACYQVGAALACVQRAVLQGTCCRFPRDRGVFLPPRMPLACQAGTRLADVAQLRSEVLPVAASGLYQRTLTDRPPPPPPPHPPTHPPTHTPPLTAHSNSSTAATPRWRPTRPPSMKTSPC